MEALQIGKGVVRSSGVVEGDPPPNDRRGQRKVGKLYGTGGGGYVQLNYSVTSREIDR